MKSILLTSTALVAFAGAAAADGHATGFGFSGAAELGYNTTDGVNDVVSDGFYWDLEVDATASTTLDNGLTASAEFGFEVANGDRGQEISGKDYVLKLAGENASLSYGNVTPANEDFSEVGGHSAADFNDKDAHFDTVLFDAILKGEASVAGFDATVSFGIDADEGSLIGEDIGAMQINVSGSVSVLDIEFGYAEELEGLTPETFGLIASTTLAGADLKLSYLQNSDIDGTAADEEESSIGIMAAYPVGPVKVGAFYSVNDVADDNFGVDIDYDANGAVVNVSVDSANGADGTADDVLEYGIEGSYDVGNGLKVFAGYLTTDQDDADALSYVAATYDLGGGAEVLFSYADDGDATVVGEDLGDPEYKEGLTVQATFTF